ncbi:MAG: hypothetical protein HY984_02280 [Candidatus Magasanikbacteria bacterium]|nr:hypothetical protein [Candidatus Magasanikbacteria bacterium]
MKEPLYRDALRHSWHFAWHNKMLWSLGLFAGALGQMGLFDFFGYITWAASEPRLMPLWWRLPSVLPSLWGQLSHRVDVVVWLIWLLVSLIGLAGFLIFFAVAGQGTVIAAAAQSARGRSVSLGAAWVNGVKHFWRLLFLNLIRKSVILLLGVSLSWAALNAFFSVTSADLLIFVLVFLLVVFVGVWLSIVTIYAAGYIIVEEYPLPDAISAAWLLFSEHWLVSLEIAAILLFFQTVAGLLAVVGIIFFFFPAVFVWQAGVTFLSPTLFLAGHLFGLATFLSFILLVGALYTLFATATWTYLFMKMHRHGVVSRILHFARGRL